MKLGVMGALFGGMKLDDALDYCQRLGLDAIELPCGAYPGDPWGLRGIYRNKKKLAALKVRIADHGLEVAVHAVVAVAAWRLPGRCAGRQDA